MTIHQPGTETYELFDNLMILLDGRIMYQNEASMITNYF
jgi:ABC-type multidrug transport system ATPase subunit